MATRVGIDTGGTFTDIARLTARGLQVHKVPSTPDDPGRAVLLGLAAVRRSAEEEVDVVHGTTVGLNAVLTQRLSRTALVTNSGFEDLIEIGRQDRRELYSLEPTRPDVPVPRRLRFRVDCRRAVDGSVVRPLRADEIRRVVEKLRRARAESVAIGLLHSPTAPEDERAIAAAIGREMPGVPVTCSAELLPVHGEFERFCAAVLNAAIAPLVGAYTKALADAIAPGTLRLMRSSQGIMDATEAAAFPARALFSGPAGGVLASEALARALGWDAVATLDMGGTSADVAFVGRRERTSHDTRIADLPLALPAVDIHTVGCGGGSVAYLDAGGALRVGPESAGADPGPACYGVGEDATVTDAHMALGHMGAETLLGGAFPVDVDASVRAVERLGRRLGLSTRRTAEGILEIAEINMLRALLVITVQRAVDPARVPLVAFGGAGGLHACTLARRLGMPAAVVPAHPGAFSAVGLALAGESRELIAPIRQCLAADREAAIGERARELAQRALKDFPAKLRRGTRVRADALLRYVGQGGGLRVPCSLRARRPNLLRDFVAEHQRRFGFVPENGEVELVSLHVRVDRQPRPLPGARSPARRTGERPAAGSHRRPPIGGSGLAVFDREALRPGQHLAGPCVIEGTTGAIRIPAGLGARVTPVAVLLEGL